MLYVAIGRNVGDKPMSGRDWELFRAEVIRAVREGSGGRILPNPNTIAFGHSEWNGVSEETAVFVWFDYPTVAGIGLDNIVVQKLKKIAKHFGQEAIAYTISETQFVEGL